MLSFSLVLFQGPQILVAMVALQRVPGGGGGQGADTAAVSAISDARHPRGALAGAYLGGRSATPQASQASPWPWEVGRADGWAWE